MSQRLFRSLAMIALVFSGALLALLAVQGAPRAATRMVVVRG